MPVGLAILVLVSIPAALLIGHYREDSSRDNHVYPEERDSTGPTLQGRAGGPVGVHDSTPPTIVPREPKTLSEGDTLQFLREAPSPDLAHWLDTQPHALGVLQRAVIRALNEPASRARVGALLLQWWLRATPVVERHEMVATWLSPKESSEFLERLIPALTGSPTADGRWISIATDPAYPEDARIAAIECARPRDLIPLIGSLDVVLENAVLTQLAGDPELQLTPADHGWIVERGCRIGRTERDIVWDVTLFRFTGQVYRDRGLPPDVLSYAVERLEFDKGESEALIAAVARCIGQAGRAQDWSRLGPLLEEWRSIELSIAILDYLPAEASALRGAVEALTGSSNSRVEQAARRAVARLLRGK